MLCPRRSAVLFGGVMVLAMPALADLPGALDRLPPDAAIIVGISSLSEMHEDLTELANLLEIPEMQQGMAMASMMLNAPGLDPDGSVAVAILTNEDGTFTFDGMPDLVAILPMLDFEAFVGMVGGEVGDEIGSVIAINFQGQEAFLRDLGRGYAALSPVDGLLDGLYAAGGSIEKIERRLGSVGTRIAGRSDVFVAVDLQVIAPFLDRGIVEMQDAMKMAAQMAGDQAQSIEQASDMIEQFVRVIADDGQMGIVGIELSDAGISLDLGAQFRAGTETAKLLDARGNASKLLDHVPDSPFLFAFAIDTSDEGAKTIMRSMHDMSIKMDPNAEMWGFMGTSKMIDNQDGMAFVLGNPPAIMMGGLLSHTTQYTQSSAPGKTLAMGRSVIEAMDGMNAQGMNATTSYESGAQTVDGVSVDSWGIKFEVDPEHRQAQMMSMTMMMIFGAQGGPSGYTAAMDTGTVTTFSRNSALMSKALEAAEKGNGLGTNEFVQRAAAQLPKDSFVEVYIGVGTIFEQVSSVMMMMGSGFEIDVPENMTPLAFGVAATDGGIQSRVFVPQDVLKLVMQLATQAEGIEGGGAGGDDEDEGGSPRF